MKILYHIPYPNSIGSERWIYDGWKYAWHDLGCQFFELTANDNLEKKISETKPDIFWTAYNLVNILKQKEILKWIKKQGVKIFFMVDWPRKKEEIEILKNEEIADIYFGEREPESMQEFEEKTGRKYYLIPNAADKKFHFPTKPVAKYQYDIIYLGAKLPKKKWFFENVLIPLTKKYKVGIFGPYWTFRDNLLRLAGKFSKKMKFSKAVAFLNKFRIVIPENEENQLYSSAKISLNFHEREKDNSQPHYILNQRTFKIPACGGFEICDYVPALRKYFIEDEVVMAALDPKDWFEKIDYYLTREEERRKIQQKGTSRALRDHTYHNRVNQVIELYKSLPKDER